MDSPAQGVIDRDARHHWVRLETLVRVRWLAVAGQVAALLAANLWFELHFPLVLCLAVVGVSAASNLLSSLVFPRVKRLSEIEVLLTLIFDTTQLALLLFLTGGLNNPFALLLIAPVTIAATALTTRSALILGAFALAFASLLALTHEPLRTVEGAELVLPDLFLFGFWLALVIGIGFIGLYSRSIATEKQALSDALMAMRLALERERKLTDLGGVVAAAAHELGTPLATIKLVSSELIDALDDPEQIADARLIREQADRCRTILRSMGQAGKDDLMLRQAPLEAVVAEAAAPHRDRGKRVEIHLPDTRLPMPAIHRHPEVIHGLRNLIQNAVDFSRSVVRIELDWTPSDLALRVLDDGPGFPAHLLTRLGEPYLRNRGGDTGRDGARPEYEGMGLGLFIAKTLLARTGAEVRFSNRGGALAEVTWPRTRIEADSRRALGENVVNPAAS